MSRPPLFVFGTLCHARLRAAVLGGDFPVTPANLPGYQAHWVAGTDFPMLRAAGGAAPGLLIGGLDDDAQARADFFELGFDYVLRDVEVAVEGLGRVPARAYFPRDAEFTSGGAWDLGAWAADWAAIWIAATDEAMGYFGRITARELAQRWPMIKLRAATRLRAAGARAPHELRAGFSAAGDVSVETRRRPYTNYFAVEDDDLRFRRFDGTMSARVTRAGFIGGDAATVLPYDPVRDRVLVVEQFRTGPFLRGDPLPWSLEPIAGRIDPGESPEDCVRREAIEETGLPLGALHHVADYYPSPGAVTEFVYSYVALADLDGRGGETGGSVDEHEDIRVHVIGFEQLMALIASGEAGTGPLILSALWLGQNRARLRGAA